MNYYPHHIGDFNNATLHLSVEEECMYHRALAWYYSKEKPLPTDKNKIYRFLRATSKKLKAAVDNVLEDFFVLHDDGYHNHRCDEEIDAFYVRSDNAKENGKKGGRPRKDVENTENSDISETQEKAKQKPNKTQKKPNENLNETQEKPKRNPTKTQTKPREKLTINQEPITINQEPKDYVYINSGESEKNSPAEKPNQNLNETQAKATGFENNANLSLDEVLNLWQPPLHDVNSWLVRAGLQTISQQEFDRRMPEFLGYYADRLQNGTLRTDKLFGKFVSWCKSDYSRKKQIDHSNTNDDLDPNRWDKLAQEVRDMDKKLFDDANVIDGQATEIKTLENDYVER